MEVPDDAKCFKCGEQLMQGIVSFRDNFYHSTCLVCDDCGEDLLSIREKNGKFYCEKDYYQRFGKKCYQCNQIIKSASIHTSGLYFHEEHFNCNRCQRSLVNDKFLMEDGQLLCMTCNGLICYSCNSIIATGIYFKIKTEDADNPVAVYHENCHKCSRCNRKMDSANMVFCEGKLYCHDDYKILFPGSPLPQVKKEEPIKELPKEEPPKEEEEPPKEEEKKEEKPKIESKPAQKEEIVATEEPKREKPIEVENEKVIEREITIEEENNAALKKVEDVDSTPFFLSKEGQLEKLENNNNSLLWLVTEGSMTQIEAEILIKEKNVAGSFFIYKTESDRPQDYSLVVMENQNDIQHLKVLEREGQFHLSNNSNLFNSIENLVKHYSTHPIESSGKRLDNPIEFSSLKVEPRVPDSIGTATNREDYVKFKKETELCYLLIEASTKLETITPTDSPFYETLTKVIEKAKSKSNLIESMMKEILTIQGDMSVWESLDKKDKFKNQEFFNAAVSILEAQIAAHLAEIKQALENYDRDEPEMDKVEMAVKMKEHGVDASLSDDIQVYWNQTILAKNGNKMSPPDFLKAMKQLLPMRKPEQIDLIYHEDRKLDWLRKRAKTEGGLDLEDFKKFFNYLFDFPDIITLFRKYAKTSLHHMTVLEFRSFLRQEQRLKNTEKILRLYYNVQSNDSSKNTIESQQTFGKYLGISSEGSLSIIGFVNYICSLENSIFNPHHATIYQDMTLPLNNYFIDSSHNSYLEGDQLKSSSTTEAYKKILQAGCRCVELDLWDGPKNEPIIYHGYTLTSKVKARDVLETIAKYAFEASPYPVTLSLENHLSLPQQKVFAGYLREIFNKDVIPDYTTQFWESNPQYLPSPEQLRGKILIKSKANETRGEDVSKSTSHHKTAQELSDMVVYTKAVTFSSLQKCKEKFKCYEMSSFAEKKGFKLLKSLPSDFIQVTAKNLARGYPDGLRFDSSNPDPQPLWNVGIQMNALNYQKPDRSMQLNEGRYAQNGRCGYLLKPAFLRDPSLLKEPLNCHTLKVKLLSAHHLPHPRGRRRTNPIIELEVTGLTNQVYTTKAHNSTFKGDVFFEEEEFEFEVYSPELEMLRITVMDSHLGPKDIVGEFSLPIQCVLEGFRKIPIKKPIPFGPYEILPHAHLFASVTFTPGKPKPKVENGEETSTIEREMSNADVLTLLGFSTEEKKPEEDLSKQSKGSRMDLTENETDEYYSADSGSRGHSRENSEMSLSDSIKKKDLKIDSNSSPITSPLSSPSPSPRLSKLGFGKKSVGRHTSVSFEQLADVESTGTSSNGSDSAHSSYYSLNKFGSESDVRTSQTDLSGKKQDALSASNNDLNNSNENRKETKEEKKAREKEEKEKKNTLKKQKELEKKEEKQNGEKRGSIFGKFFGK